MKFRRARHYEPPEINFIPLIDVLLVILIFLMVTTTYSRFSELDITLPTANAQTEEEKAAQEAASKPILIAVSEQGELMLNETSIPNQDLKALGSALETAAQGRDKSKIVVIINADAKAAHQKVIRVMEAARNSGFTQLTFATQNSQ